MTNHEYLMQIRLLNKKINNKIVELEQLRITSEGVSAIRYDKDKVQTSQSSDGILNSVVKIIETENEINAMIDEYVDLKNKIISVIEQLTIPEEYDAIHKYYVQDMSWQQVADSIGYTYDGVMKLKNRAIEKLSI